jgi:uncharacterized protein
LGRDRRLGVPESAIQTSNFSVQPQYADNRGGNAPAITGYQVSNQVDVMLDDTKKLGPALDVLVGAGANQINSVGFTIKDPSALEAKAREAAVADALAHAQSYAHAAGVGLGPVIAIQEGGSGSPMPLAGLARFSVARAPTPAAAGELDVSASVDITFELK